jgi:hypothetical protein
MMTKERRREAEAGALVTNLITMTIGKREMKRRTASLQNRMMSNEGSVQDQDLESVLLLFLL